MSAWGNLLNIFEKPASDSLSSWPHLLPRCDATAAADPSFEMFGELYDRVGPYKTHPHPHFNKSLSWKAAEPIDANAFEIFGELCYKRDVPPPEEGLRCTEGLGFESTVVGDDAVREEPKRIMYRRSYSDSRERSTDGGLVYPPPISTIGRTGKPRVYFKSYRKDGRFVLKEVRIPTQQLLHSTRENGRLRMRVVGPDEDKIEGSEEEEGEEEEEDGKERVSDAGEEPSPV